MANAPEPKNTTRAGDDPTRAATAPVSAVTPGRSWPPDLLALFLLTRADRDEVVERLEVVDVELAGEVVELVLEGASEEPGARDLDLLAQTVLGDDPDSLLAGDVGHVARDREAAFEVPVLAGRADDARVDELVELLLDLDDAGLERLAQLRRGEADAGCVAHRLGQVVEQLVEVLAEAVDRLAAQAQASHRGGRWGRSGRE
jgi:hypothetical protein